ncbi:MAG: DUF1579 family protein [Planctomycetes bacterium]|nr:DUF1579 family protein [Planctomycetota bacterium]
MAVTLLTAILALPALAQCESCPQAGPEHEKLYYFIGEWTGEETWAACEQMPEGGKGASTYEVKRTLGGMFVEMEYSTQIDKTFFQGKAILGYDAQAKCYRMWWFDCSGTPCLEPASGKWDGNTLVFEGSGECGGVAYKGRYTYEIKGHNEFVFTMACSFGGADLAETFRSTVKRVGGRLAASSAGPAQSAGASGAAGAELPECCKKAASTAAGAELSECCKKAAEARATGGELPDCCKKCEEAKATGGEMPDCCKKQGEGAGGCKEHAGAEKESEKDAEKK